MVGGAANVRPVLKVRVDSFGGFGVSLFFQSALSTSQLSRLPSEPSGQIIIEWEGSFHLSHVLRTSVREMP